jgi:hypothetical protein
MISRTKQWLEEHSKAFFRTPFGCLARLFASRMLRGGGDVEAGELDLGVGVILVLLAMPGLLVSLLMFEKYGSLIRFLRGDGVFDPFTATIPDEYFFIVLSASVTGAAALWRWDAIFLDRRDYTNLVPLPLSLRALFFANLCAVLGLAGVFTVVANGASLLLFPVAVVGSQNSLSLFLRFAAGHAVAVFSASVFSFFAIFGLAGLLTALLPPTAFRSVSLAIRFVAAISLLALLVTSFTVPDLLKQLSMTNAHRIAVLPPVSFLGMARTVWGKAGDGASAGMTRAALITMGLSVLTAIIAYAFSFRRSFIRLPELTDAGPLSRMSFSFSPLAWFHKLTLRSLSNRACYQFVARSLLRSDGHLQVLLCFVAVGLVVSAETLTSRSNHYSAWSGSAPPVEFLSIPFILSYCTLLGIRFAFEIPLDLRANWVFRFWLDPEQHNARSAARRVLLVFSWAWLGPAVFVFTFVFWGLSSAILHTAIWTACTAVFVETLLIRFRKMPFTFPYPSFQSHSPLAAVAYLFGFLIFKSYLPQLDLWSVLNPIRSIWVIPLLGAAVASLYWYRKQMLDMDKRLIFEDISASGF